MSSISSLFKGFKLNAILTAIVECILGIFLIINPGASQFALCTLVGIGILIYGIAHILSYFKDHYEYWDTVKLIIGICAIVVALIFLFNPGFLFDFIGIILGLFVIVCACNEIRRAMTLRALNFEKWWIAMIAGIIFIALGLSFILFANVYGDILMIAIGVFLVMEAISDLVTILQISRIAKNVKNNVVIRY